MAGSTLIAALLLGLVAAAAAAGTVEPTPSVTCPKKATYVDTATNSCKNCVSRGSPFKKTYGSTTCYPPTTLGASSSTCTNAVQSAFVLSNLGRKNTVVGCINPFKKTIRIVLSSHNAHYPFVKPSSFVGDSLLLAGRLKRDGGGDGTVVKTQPGGISRVFFSFTQFNTKFLRKKGGQIIQLTGTLKRDGDLLDYCFVSYLLVCG